jgi:hypothetical protein
LSVVANGQPRFQKVRACGRPVAYFGGFIDRKSRHAAQDAGWILADEYLPYGHGLAAGYHRIKISIDVANAPFINGFSSKILGCFAAGGFALTSRKIDMATELGSVVDAIGFSNADELSGKVDDFLSHDRKRIEVANEIRDIVLRKFTTSGFLSRTVPRALEGIGVRAPDMSGTPRGVSYLNDHPNHDVGMRLFDVPLDSLVFWAGSSGSVDDHELSFQTSPQQWAYSLSALAIGESKITDAAIVRVELQVVSGQLGLAIESCVDYNTLIVEFPVRASTQSRIIDIPVARLDNVRSLIIRNQSSEGASEAQILSIQVFRPKRLAS